MLGQSKFEGYILFRDLNQKMVDTVLVTVAHYNCPVEDVYMGFTYVTLEDIVSVITKQWEDRI